MNQLFDAVHQILEGGGGFAGTHSEGLAQQAEVEGLAEGLPFILMQAVAGEGEFGLAAVGIAMRAAFLRSCTALEFQDQDGPV